MIKSEICYIVGILKRKSWGKTLIGGRLRSEYWWRNYLNELINKDEDPIPPENIWDGSPVDYSMPYEVEFSMSNASDCSYWLENHA